MTCDMMEIIAHSKKFYVFSRSEAYTIFLSFWTDRSWQTVQTQIRLLQEEQSDQGLLCLQFPLYLLDALL